MPSEKHETEAQQWDWRQVRNLLRDLEADGYQPSQLFTDTSSCEVDEKLVQIEVERP